MTKKDFTFGISFEIKVVKENTVNILIVMGVMIILLLMTILLFLHYYPNFPRMSIAFNAVLNSGQH